MESKKYYTYIILREKNTLYCGYTDNVEKRFLAHLNGKGAKYTRAFKPKELVFVKEFSSKSEAMNEEIRIKKLSKKDKLHLIKQQNCDIKNMCLQNLTIQ